MRIIEGLYAPPRTAYARLRMARLHVGDVLMYAVPYNERVGLLWTCGPDGAIHAPRGAGRIRVSGGAVPLYRGNWPAEAVALYRLVRR
jgi:hypothetical protein